MKLHFPGGKELPIAANGAWGEEVKADGGRADRAGVVDDGNVAWPERVIDARRHWPEARAEDFEQTGKRMYVDKASGNEYRRPPGAPLLSVGTAVNTGISCFFVDASGEIVFLQPASYDPTVRVHHGPVVAMQIHTAGGGGSGIH